MIPTPPPPSARPPAPRRPRASVTWPVSRVAPLRKRISGRYPLLLFPMHVFGTECGHADSHVLSALRRGVAHFLAGVGQYGLPGAHGELAAVVLDDDRALEDDGD